MSFQPFFKVDAGPWLPQPVKTKDEGEAYFYGRGVREAPDTDVSVLRFADRDLPRTDVEKARIDAKLVGSVQEPPPPEESSTPAGADAKAQRWLREEQPSSQPAAQQGRAKGAPQQPQRTTARATPWSPSWDEEPTWWHGDAWTWSEWEEPAGRNWGGQWRWRSHSGWKWE